MPRFRLVATRIRELAAALTILGLYGGAAAATPGLGPLTRITGTDPFAACRADGIAAQERAGSTLYPGTEIEPWVAADPTDPDRLLSAWQQDRWSDGGSRGLIAGVSGDGGASWRSVTTGKVAKCAGGPWTRASDPWVAFSKTGIAYAIHLAFEPDLPSGGFGPTAVIVTRSADHGLTWGRPITLIRDPGPQISSDKQSITADPANPNLAYAVWDEFADFSIPSAAASTVGVNGRSHDVVALTRERLRRLGTGEIVAPTAAAAPVVAGPIYFSRTTDAGKSWTPGREIYDPGTNNQTIGNQILVLPDGTLVDFFTEITATGLIRLKLLRSFDKGRTFEPQATLVSPQINGNLVGTVTPDRQLTVRDANILFDVAVNPKTGQLYAVWQDVRFTAGIQSILLATSKDGGRSWKISSGPINKTPDNVKTLRQQAFIPSIEVAADGRLAVTYYDFRNDGGVGELVDYWAVFCGPGKADCTDPGNWGNELRLTAKSFDILDAPDAGGLFLGDYMGLTRAGDAVVPVFGIADGKNRTSLYTRRITLSGKAVAAR